MRRSVLPATVFLLSAHLPAMAAAPPAEAVAVRVNGVLIPQERVQAELENLMYSRKVIHSGATVSTADANDFQVVYDRIITRELLLQEARSSGCAVGPEETKKAWEAEQQRWGSPEKFQKSLKLRGISEDSLRDRVAQDCLVRKLLNDQVFKGLEPTEQQEREYYQAHLADFRRAEEGTLRVIRTGFATHGGKGGAAAAMKTVRAGILAGEPFPELARKYSDLPSAARGGEIGTDPVPHLEVARALRPSQFSDMQESADGLYVYFRDRPGQIPFEEVRPKINAEIRTQLRNQKFEQYVQGLREKAKIEYLPPAPAAGPK